MPDNQVAFVHRVECHKCGLVASGYLEALQDGTGVTDCPRCGAVIRQKLPSHYVAQIPAEDFNSPVRPHPRMSHYPGLYDRPKQQPRLDFKDLVKVLYSPAKALPSLYTSTNLERGMSIVILFSLVSACASALITAGLSKLLGLSVLDAFQMSAQVVITWLITLFAFLLFCAVSSGVAKGVFGGRGERGMTITLVGYCFPAYVLLSIAALSVFTVGFHDIHLAGWTSVSQGIGAGILLFFLALGGLIWLTWIVSRSVSVANDISMAESTLTSILAAVPAGLVFLMAGALMRLPIGLFP